MQPTLVVLLQPMLASPHWLFMSAGVPIKTRVAPQVLDAAYAGNVEPEALALNQPVSGWVWHFLSYGLGSHMLCHQQG